MNAHFLHSTPSSSIPRPLFLSSSHLPRRRRAPHLRKPPSPTPTPVPTVHLSLDTDRLHSFLASASDALRDLRGSVQVHQSPTRLVFSCRRSSLLFALDAILCGVVIALSARGVLWLWGRGRWGGGEGEVRRRDRSLGGREVVVGRRVGGIVGQRTGRVGTSKAVKRRNRERSLPEWWPHNFSSPVVSFMGMEDGRREAAMLVRAITDKRMRGEDYKEDDIIQLRRICRTTGARAFFDTTNARDALYRASIGFAFDICGRAGQLHSPVQIDGEDVRKFLAGLAHDIGLDDNRAVVLLLGAVAAKTRSCFLQAWALEAQGKRLEALQELSKIYKIHQTFPPENDAPEIEMVASGLRKNLNVEQRSHLLGLLGEIYGTDNYSTAAASLGLNGSHRLGEGVVDHTSQ